MMTETLEIKSTTELMIVETIDDVFLGMIEVDGDVVVIYTGLRGRPKVLVRDEITQVTPADGHPDVEEM